MVRGDSTDISDPNVKILILIQARTTSSRLPNKVLLDILGKPMLVRMYERVSSLKTTTKIVVATTTDSLDQKIVDVCKMEGIEVFCGHPTDLLDRHYQAALYYGAANIAKIPSDCPLIDTDIIDKVFQEFSSTGCDYASNLHPATFPDGNDVEIMTIGCLKTAWKEAVVAMEREHTTPFIWERPERFKVENISCIDESDGKKSDFSMSHRWTLDYYEDYLMIRKVFEALYKDNNNFGMTDILSFLTCHPEIMKINEKYAGVNWYRHHLGELKTITAKQTKII